jgi:hypothetical protein
MTRGSEIPVAVQWIIIRLSSLLQKEDISIYTGVSIRAVARILQYYRMHGGIKTQNAEERRGNRHLRDLDVEVSIVFVSVPLFDADIESVLAWNCTTDTGYIP